MKFQVYRNYLSDEKQCLSFAKKCLKTTKLPLNPEFSHNLRHTEKYHVNFAHTENYKNSSEQEERRSAQVEELKARTKEQERARKEQEMTRREGT